MAFYTKKSKTRPINASSMRWYNALSQEDKAIVDNARRVERIDNLANYSSSRYGEKRGKKQWQAMGGQKGYDATFAPLLAKPQLAKEYNTLGQGRQAHSGFSPGALFALSTAAMGGAAALGGSGGAAALGGSGGAAGSGASVASGWGATGSAAGTAGTVGATALPAGGMVGTGTLSAADAALMGVGGTGATSAAGGGSTVLGGAANWLNGNLGTSLTGNQLLKAGGNLAGSYLSSKAAKDAADTQSQYGQLSLDEARRQFDIGQANQQPYLQAGGKSVNALTDLLGLGQGGYAAAQSQLENSPGYQWRFNQGQQARERAAAAGGMSNSGNVLAELEKYGQGMASQEYGNRVNQLAGLTRTGQASASGMAQQGNNYAQNYGNTITGIGNARALGDITSGNAWQSGILGATNALAPSFY